MKTYTTIEAAVELNVDLSLIQRLCKQGRLGYTMPRHGRAWVITEEEIEKHRTSGRRKSGRPRLRPLPEPRLSQINPNGKHDYI